MFLLLLMSMKLVTVFNKKLTVLLIMEIMMIVLILVACKHYSSLNMSIYIMMILTMFMVLDSVLGISMLVSNARSNTIKNSSYQNI